MKKIFDMASMLVYGSTKQKFFDISVYQMKFLLYKKKFVNFCSVYYMKYMETWDDHSIFIFIINDLRKK